MGGEANWEQLRRKIALPQFSGYPLRYVEFKQLISELLGSMCISEPTAMEYLRRSLDEKLLYIIRGAKERGEA